MTIAFGNFKLLRATTLLHWTILLICTILTKPGNSPSPTPPPPPTHPDRGAFFYSTTPPYPGQTDSDKGAFFWRYTTPPSQIQSRGWCRCSFVIRSVRLKLRRDRYRIMLLLHCRIMLSVSASIAISATARIEGTTAAPLLSLLVVRKPSSSPTSHLVTMVRCCVPDCANDTRQKKGWSFFSFPTDQYLTQKWLKKISRLGFVPTPGSRVCSEHFEAECFERDLLAELLPQPSSSTSDRRRRRRLKVDAVPTIFPARQTAKARPRTSLYQAKKAHKEVRGSSLHGMFTY